MDTTRIVPLMVMLVNAIEDGGQGCCSRLHRDSVLETPGIHAGMKERVHGHLSTFGSCGRRGTYGVWSEC